MSFAFPGACSCPKNCVRAFRISGGTAAPQRPQNLCPTGTGVEHERHTKFLAGSMSSSSLFIFGAEFIGARTLAFGAAAKEGSTVGATISRVVGGALLSDASPRSSARLLEHNGQAVAPSAA